MKIAAVGLMILLASLSIGVGVGGATPDMMPQLKKAGVKDAKNCQYCHTEALPKKETFKPDALNDRGKFLQTDMQTRGLKSPDMKKLDDFPGGKEQK